MISWIRQNIDAVKRRCGSAVAKGVIANQSAGNGKKN
jgi:hypothetical protein